MRVLYVTPRPPHPPEEGDQLIAFEQVKRLGSSVELHLASLRTELSDEAAARRALEPLCKTLTFLPGGKDMRRIVRSLYNGLPMMVNLFHGPAITAAAKRVVDEIRPDVVHVQTIHLAECFRSVRRPKVLDMIDALSLNLQRRAEFETPWRAPIYRWESARLRRYEDGVFADYDRVSVVSGEDAAYFGSSRVVVNPNGVGITPERIAACPVEPREQALVFHGTMRYFPNVDAAVHFARAVFPALRARHPDLKLYLVGRRPRPAVQALHDGSHIIVTGEVPDVVPLLRRCLIGVYPLRTGTGMKNKVLEALACGLPAVVSPRALEGLPGIRVGEHVVLARSDAEWIERVDGLLSDDAARRRFADAGPAAVFGQYSWDENARRLAALWQEVMG